ncbi:hypothetical protein O181_107525, partial [Austropuccinia psidii MF-1]|nr:hypothetical protein [Austropuccinia psidii MF-1]
MLRSMGAIGVLQDQNDPLGPNISPHALGPWRGSRKIKKLNSPKLEGRSWV